MPPSEPLPKARGSLYEGECLSLLHKVENLALRLIRFDFSNSADIWAFQLELMSVQRLIQQEITDEKGRVRREKKKPEALQSLQLVRWHARRLGDALAWALLGADRSIIYPLGENSPVSISQEDHGSRGLVAASEYLASQGWGFPLLHDVTDCLRIGDVSFIRFDGSHRKVRTAEAKTRYLGAAPDHSDGSQRYDVSISFLEAGVAGKEPDLQLNVEVDRSSQSSPEPATRRDDRRIGRQTGRMRNALIRQNAMPNTLYEVDGKKSLSAHAESLAHSQWPKLKKAVKEARKSGYASASIDGAFMYACYYNPDGIAPETMDKNAMISDVKNSGILSEGPGSRNSLTISSVPLEPRRDTQQYLPFYLYSIPEEAISDILHGRLMILILANAGAVAAAIEQDGIEVEIPPGNAPLYSMKFHSRFDSGSGGYRIELRGMGMHVCECIYEFRSVEYLRDVVRGIKRSVELTLPEMIDLNRSNGTGDKPSH
ncbi:hypothetical protein [Kitasatospora sp. NPDC085879]|uniref:hypothetical protein n=1 Tax=Kitasatospora sp. NPDC085879 TaxID=3154769 RepID=UPI003427053F